MVNNLAETPKQVGEVRLYKLTCFALLRCHAIHFYIFIHLYTLKLVWLCTDAELLRPPGMATDNEVANTYIYFLRASHVGLDELDQLSFGIIAVARVLDRVGVDAEFLRFVPQLFYIEIGQLGRRGRGGGGFRDSRFDGSGCSCPHRDEYHFAGINIGHICCQIGIRILFWWYGCSFKLAFDDECQDLHHHSVRVCTHSNVSAT